MAWVLLAFVLVGPARAAGRGDPLPSWREGPARRAILHFVASVTRSGTEDYVPPEERIAVFDNDGTLLAEKPLYFQLYFFMERIRELAPQHPEWKEQQPFKAVIEDDHAYLADIPRPELEELVLEAAGSGDERAYQASVMHFLDEAEHPQHGVPFTRLVYQPMLELLEYLRARGFRIYLVSAAAPELIRGFSEKVYGIPRERVIGSDMMMRFESGLPRPNFGREPLFVRPINDRAGKPVNIERVVGRSPILAFGNSDGDVEMLEYTAYSGHPHLGLLLRHDDAEREYAYDTGAEEALALAPERGWVIVSMKETFRRMFPSAPRPRTAR